MSFTLKSVHHVGITVRDMKRSFEWYKKMFDIDHGPINHNEGPALEAGVQVPGAQLDYSMIEIANVRIEFLEYQHPRGDDFALRNCDVGAAHVCFEVDDLEAAYAALTERGAEFNAPPVTLTEGSLTGSKWAYLRDPDGVQLELWQWPKTD